MKVTGVSLPVGKTKTKHWCIAKVYVCLGQSWERTQYKLKLYTIKLKTHSKENEKNEEFLVNI